MFVAPGKCRVQIGSGTPFTEKTCSDGLPGASCDIMYVTVASIWCSCKNLCSAFDILSTTSPLSGARPVKEGTSRCTAAISSGSVNQTKLSKTTREVATFASSTTNVIVI